MEHRQLQDFQRRLGDAESLANNPEWVTRAAVLANISVAEAIVDLATAIREYIDAEA